MALDFSKFILKPDFSGFEKLPEYTAAGIKAAKANAADTGFYKELNRLTDSGKYLSTSPYISNATRDYTNNKLKEIQQRAMAGYAADNSYSTNLANVRLDLNNLATTLSKANTLAKTLDEVENNSKNKKWINQGAFRLGAIKKYHFNEDGSPKDIEQVLNEKDGNPITSVTDLADEIPDLYNQEGFGELIKSGEGVTTTYTTQERDKKGLTTGKVINFNVPSNYMEVKNLETDPAKTPDYVPVVKGTTYTVTDPKISAIYKGLINPDHEGDSFDVTNDDVYQSIMTKEGISAYVNQQARNFEKAMQANGVQIQDATTGQYTPEYQEQLDNFKKATAYQALTDAYNNYGGSSIKAGTTTKYKLPSQPRSHRGSGTPSMSPYTKSEFFDTMNRQQLDTDNRRSIKGIFAGFHNIRGQNYGDKVDLKIGFDDNDRTWKVYAYGRDDNDNIVAKDTMTLSEFNTYALSQDQSLKDGVLINLLREWTQKNTPGKTN